MKGMKRAFVKSENLATIQEENEPMIKLKRTDTNENLDKNETPILIKGESVVEMAEKSSEKSDETGARIESDMMDDGESFDLATFCRMALLL